MRCCASSARDEPGEPGEPANPEINDEGRKTEMLLLYSWKENDEAAPRACSQPEAWPPRETGLPKLSIGYNLARGFPCTTKS